MNQERQYLFDRPRNIKRVLYGLYAACTITLLLELVVHRHTEHPWEGLPGYYPAYGFVGCVILVLVAKWMRRFIMRPEDYYSQRDLTAHPAREGGDE